MNDTDEQLKLLLIESLDAELGPRLDARPRVPSATSAHRRNGTRGWLAPLAAAAAVVAVATTIAVTVGTDDSGPAASSGGVRVSCRAAAGVSAAPDAHLLETRARALTRGDVSSTVKGSTVIVDVHGAGREDVASLCLPTSVQLRPVVAAARRHLQYGSFSKPAPPVGPATFDFSVPTTEQAFARLPALQQAAVREALQNPYCGNGKSSDAVPVIVCDSDSDALLTGAPIVTQAHIASATAQAPNVAAGSRQWTVRLTFDRTGDAAWSAYTARHNVSGSASTDGGVGSCSPTSTPCADYVAFVVNGRALSAPVNETPIAGGSTQISGGHITRASARALASGLSAEQLPVPLQQGPITALG